MLLSSIYRKRIIRKQARVEWSIGVIGAVALLATVGLIESDAAGLGQTREYGACMRLARVSPTEGFATALDWSDAGGGGAAKHCAAVALISMGLYAEAAIRFEGLAEELRAVILRASAYRHIDRLHNALRDAVRAIELSPNYPEAYLERGNIRRLLNDVEGARQDWLALLTRFEGTPAADAAQRNIEKLDLRTE